MTARVLFTGLLVSICACCACAQLRPVPSGFVDSQLARRCGGSKLLVMLFSGRSLRVDAPDGNTGYLLSPETGLIPVLTALRKRYSALGPEDLVSVEYSDHLWTHPSNGDPASLQRGYLDAESDVDAVLACASRPKIVFVAHSHGSVWAHLLARRRVALQIDLLIDLDAIGFLWETDHRGAFAWAYKTRALSGDLDPARSARIYRLPGREERFNLEDVVPQNVRWALEAQSGRGALGDRVDNRRLLDGSREGIQTYRSQTETHSGIWRSGSRALEWIIDQIRGGAGAPAL